MEDIFKSALNQFATHGYKGASLGSIAAGAYPVRLSDLDGTGIWEQQHSQVYAARRFFPPVSLFHKIVEIANPFLESMD